MVLDFCGHSNNSIQRISDAQNAQSNGPERSCAHLGGDAAARHHFHKLAIGPTATGWTGACADAILPRNAAQMPKTNAASTLLAHANHTGNVAIWPIGADSMLRHVVHLDAPVHADYSSARAY